MIRPNRTNTVFALTIALALTGALVDSVNTTAMARDFWPPVLNQSTGCTLILDTVHEAFEALVKAGHDK
jgi:hypothetical protein